MTFHLVPAPEDMYVEGQSDAPGVDGFGGRVLAICVRGADPLAAAGTERRPEGGEEGMLGWGTTYFLVSDPGQPAPVWIAKHEVEKHWLGQANAAGDPPEAQREQLAQEGRLRQTEQEERGF